MHTAYNEPTKPCQSSQSVLGHHVNSAKHLLHMFCSCTSKTTTMRPPASPMSRCVMWAYPEGVIEQFPRGSPLAASSPQDTITRSGSNWQGRKRGREGEGEGGGGEGRGRKDVVAQ